MVKFTRNNFAAYFKTYNMYKFTMICSKIAMMTVLALVAEGLSAQNQFEELKKNQDTIKENVSTLKDQVTGVEERITTAEADLAKLTKIKFSGYIQAQYLHYEAASSYPADVLQLRRARVKLQYEPLNGVVLVLQPDFVPGNITLKDAYVQLNDRWLKTFSLWAGKFNRPVYEVEYSSGLREVPERSKVIRAIYPDERAIGAKLEVNPQNLPFKLQLALFNGNDGLTIPDAAGININPVNNDFDNHKDFMGRLIYNTKLGNWGALNLGTHIYYGKIKANTTYLLNSDYSYNQKLSGVGDLIKKNWLGFETQVYLDVLGGLAIKGEYIFGVNGIPGYTSQTTVTGSQTVNSIANDTVNVTTVKTITTNNRPAIEKNFRGGYIYLIKNIGKKHQVAFRYDYYDPNTRVGADTLGIGYANWDAKVKSTTTNNITYTGTSPVLATNLQTKTVENNSLKSGVSDVKYHTFTLAYSYYFDDNIKLMVGYEIPINVKLDKKSNGTSQVITSYSVNGEPGYYDYANWLKQNTLTIRLQAKF